MSIQSTQRPFSPLRRRMLEDMAMRGLREETQRDYLRFVSSFATFLGRALDTATAEDIRRFQVHQTQSGAQPPTINAADPVAQSALEVADVFRRHGAAWRAAHAGHVSLEQLKVMSAIESCRTAALGGHIEGCQDCGQIRIAYNSCRNRHCPKCQGNAAREWLAARKADLLPVGYFHVVFTVPAEVADIAFHNKAVVYDLLFKAASETMLTIAADPRHLGARIGITAVLHT